MKNSKIVVEVAELITQAEAFLAESAQAERPEHRISKIVRELRLYKAAVIAANVPRGYRQEQGRECLRKHREAAHEPGMDLARIGESLKTLNNKFLLGPVLEWRLDDAEWEEHVWTPIFKWVKLGFDLLFGHASTDDWPRPLNPVELKIYEDQEQELEWTLMERIRIFLPTGDEIILDESDPFTIRWHNQTCLLGDTDQFRIIKLLAKAKGRQVHREVIAEAIGNDDLSGDALRTAASRLKTKLKGSGMSELAKRIKTSEYGQHVYLAPSILDDVGEDS